MSQLSYKPTPSQVEVTLLINVSIEMTFTLAIDGRDYIGGAFTVTFTSGQSAAGISLQCLDIEIINDHSLEYNKVFSVTLNTSQQDASVVRISNTQYRTLVTITEDPEADSKYKSTYIHDHTFLIKSDVHIGMMEVYYQVVEGQQPLVTLCAELYQGELGRNLTVMLTILNTSIENSGMYIIVEA